MAQIQNQFGLFSMLVMSADPVLTLGQQEKRRSLDGRHIAEQFSLRLLQIIHAWKVLESRLGLFPSLRKHFEYSPRETFIWPACQRTFT